MIVGLLPKNEGTREGKTHLTTVPLKLISAKNSKHQSHPCKKFARISTNALEELAILLGAGDVIFHSQDKKLKIKLRFQLDLRLPQSKSHC